jgi:hypothetical protein
MNWLKNITDKVKDTSSKILTEYKQGLNEFVSNLNEDIESLKKNTATGEKTDDKAEVNSPNSININSAMSKNFAMLKDIIEPILTRKSCTIEELEKLVEKVEKQEQLLRKDPLNLVLIERDDFTNFTVFYENYRSKSDILEKILNYDANLPKLLINDTYQPGKQENTTRFLLRYIYLIIYYLETKPKEDTTTTTTTDTTTTIKTSTRGGDHQTVENAYAEDTNDNKDPSPRSRKSLSILNNNHEVNSPSSFTELSFKSNEEEKGNESSGKNSGDERKPHSESDDWQIEDTNIAI